ncbi:transposase [Carboxydocella sp. ULO1]|uniref:transposase n=1 Tax=Carboxydocella sp. ULO1 TaxID=1926599 RepID=UPI0009D6082A|nr:transposase [Carboxydocella sp. ULO1]GAW28874.1 transposase [Carboxydocella sp. ULO1]
MKKIYQDFEKSQNGQICLFCTHGAWSLDHTKYLRCLSDRETVEEIAENHYLQYFIGLTGFVQKPPFDPSLMVHFRKRLDKDIINEVNELIAKPAAKPQKEDKRDDNKDDNSSSNAGKSSSPDSPPSEEQPNRGKLILDATCTPADIRYPRDLIK